MRIAVVRTQVPFVHGGAERHAANLCEALRRHGHEATEVAIPFRWYPGPVLVDHVMAAKLIDLERFEGAPVDLMVGLKFPAWLARHPNRVFWILHQHRQAYDMWESGLSDLLHEPDGVAIRELIRAEDRTALGAPGARVFANSGNVAGRLRRHLGLSATPLYHPPPNAEALRPGTYGDTLLAPGRITPAKRQGLMIEALARVKGPVRLVIAGPADSEAHLAELKARAGALGVADRIEWTGAIDDATMVRLYAEARAVIYTPIDEDYGYVTLEAMLAAKPLIVTTDSGGPLEFVRDGIEGRVVAPEAEALARAFEAAMDDPAGAERMGEAGLERYRGFHISWDTVVERLTDPKASPPVGAAPAPVSAVPRDIPAAGKVEEISGSASSTGAMADMPPAAGGDREDDSATHAEIQAASPAPTVTEEPDLAALAALIAPPMPEEAPFDSIAALMAAHEFDTWSTGGEPDPGALAYFGTHWQRYLATLALVTGQEGGRPPRRVLDIGIFPPFLFQALLAHAFPDAVLEGVWEEAAPFSQTVRPRTGKGREFEVSVAPANVERDPLPFPDGRHDLVLAMEILEHLAVDPFHFLSEAARVLAPGGRLVLTTPNVASHRGVRKMLDGDAPYSFGLFVPTGGPYGRHNREWTPREVAALAEAAGFETERLLTADLYGDHIDPEVARLLLARNDDFSLRGETILYVGRRRSERAGPQTAELPAWLYHGDPRLLYGRLELVSRDETTGRTRLRAKNLSRRHWAPAGAGGVSLYLEWFDADGAFVHGGAHVSLGGPLGPGEAAELTLQLDAGRPEGAPGTVSVELMTGTGRIAGTGRANRIRLPCSETAFLRIARAGMGMAGD